MNTSSRVPGVSRNSGWRVVDIEIASRRADQGPNLEPRSPAPFAQPVRPGEGFERSSAGWLPGPGNQG